MIPEQSAQDKLFNRVNYLLVKDFDYGGFSRPVRDADELEATRQIAISLIEELGVAEAKVAELEQEIELRIEQGAALNIDKENFKAKVAEQAATLAKLETEIKSGDEICDALTAKYAECPHHPISDYKKGVSGECGCSYDHIGDVCGLHSPALKAAQETVTRQAVTIERLGNELDEQKKDLILSAAMLLNRLKLKRQLDGIRTECFDDSHWAKMIDAALSKQEPATAKEGE